MPTDPKQEPTTPSSQVRERPAIELTGSTVGSYRIVAWIGAGGMGEVYRAHDTSKGASTGASERRPT